VKDPSGIRIGVQEVTRLGMGPEEMEEIAGFIYEVLVEGRDPQAVAKKVSEFRRAYTRVHYAVEPGQVETLLDLLS